MKIRYILISLIIASACKDDASYKNQRISNALQLFGSCASQYIGNGIVDCWRDAGKIRDDFPHQIKMQNGAFLVFDDRFNFEINFFRDEKSSTLWKCSIKEPGLFQPKQCITWKHGE